MSLFAKLLTTSEGDLQLVLSGGPGQFSLNVLYTSMGSSNAASAHFFNRYQNSDETVDICYSIVRRTSFANSSSCNDIVWYSFVIILRKFVEAPFTIPTTDAVRPFGFSAVTIMQDSRISPSRVYRSVNTRSSVIRSTIDVTDPLDYCATMLTI